MFNRRLGKGGSKGEVRPFLRDDSVNLRVLPGTDSPQISAVGAPFGRDGELEGLEVHGSRFTVAGREGMVRLRGAFRLRATRLRRDVTA